MLCIHSKISLVDLPLINAGRKRFVGLINRTDGRGVLFGGNIVARTDDIFLLAKVVLALTLIIIKYHNELHI